MNNKKTKKNISDIKADDLTLDEKASLLSGVNVWHTKAIERLGVRALTLRDGPHGIRDGSPAMSYPNLCLLSCGWDREAMFKIGQYLGDDAVSHGVDVLLAPGVNIKRTPTGGRNFEYFSEDPFLTGALASEFVKGVQSRGVAACVKHFVCNDRENGRYAYSVNIDKKTLREVYAKPFETVIKNAEPKCLMSAYNFVNGHFAYINNELKTMLRNDFGFTGVVVSDWGGTDKRSEFLAAAGDLEMPGSDKKTHADVIHDIALGKIPIEKINESVNKILKLIAFCSGEKQAALKKDVSRIAAESIVLLKNNGLLPLNKDLKLAVVGSAANECVFCGGGCAEVFGDDYTSVKEEIEKTFKNTTYFDKPSEEIEKYDAVIVFLREKTSSEGFDRENIDIDCEVLEEIYRYNKNLVTVLINGSVVKTEEIEKYSSSIIESYFAGQTAGRAISLVLSGEVNPCGRLTETLVKDLSDSYAFGEENDDEIFYREGTSVGYRYYVKNGIAVAYPFGFGLSYTDFVYSDFKIDKSSISENDDGVTVSVNVKNVGDYDGKEVVQIYLSGDGKNGDPVIKLVGFDKIYLKRGEEKQVSVFVPTSEFTSFEIKKDRFVLRKGKVRLSVNSDATKELFGEEISLNPVFKIDRYTTIGELIKSEKGAKVTEKKLKKAIIGCIIGDDDNYPFSIKNGHIEGETFFSRVAESLQLRQLVTMSNNKMTEDELTKIIDVLNEQGEDFK